MDTVQLKDGSIEIIGSHRDLVDIVRDKCGNDVAKMIEELDPIEWNDVYAAYDTIMEIDDIIQETDDDGALSSEQIAEIHNKIDIVQDMLSGVL